MDFRTCIEEGKKALSEGRMADARRWFESAAKLNPQDWEANLQFALSALLCGDRRTFESVLAARQAPPEESSPRVHQLWRTALRFAGSLATAAAIVAAVPACSSSSRESAATTASSGDKPAAAEPTDKQKEPVAMQGDSMDAEDGDEVYSKHRYSAGVRPPVFDEAAPSMDATPVMKPEDMRPPALKYGLYRPPMGTSNFD